MDERSPQNSEARAQATAKNARLLRRARGWSTREFAQRAGLSHRTVVNLENGRICSARTEEKVAAALGTTRSGLWQAQDASERVLRRVGAEEGRWFFGDGEEAARYRQSQERAGEAKDDDLVESPDSIQCAAERFRLGTNGRASTFVQVKGGALLSGRHLVCVSEVFRTTLQAPDPNAATYLFHMTQGEVETEFEGTRCALRPGDTMVFVARSSLTIGPTGPIDRLEDVPRVLVTSLSLLSATD